MHPLILSMTKQQVIGSLEATGSTDPDVLAAAKEELLSSVKVLKMAALAPLLGGVAMMLSVIGALVGVPLFLAGVWAWRRADENVRTVEAGFAEHARSISRAVPLARM